MARELVLVLLCFHLYSVRTQSSQLYYEINEEIGPGSIIGDIVKDARLADKYEHNTIPLLRFQFLTQPAANLSVDPRSGLISTSGRLDRDVICAGFFTCIVPLDIAIHANKIFQVVKASVEILDLNDNSPKFPDPRISFQVLESAHPGATSFLIPEARDPDSPSNAVQSYELVAEGSDAWRLNVEEEVDGAREVMLALTDHLDRETNGHYHLQVVAYDGGSSPRSGSIDIFIEVEDANDNSPVFDSASYEVTIDENTPRLTNIIQLRAQDADWGVNGKVQYSLSARSASTYGHLFGIHNSTGQVFVKGAVDFESSPSYHLTIVARDSGSGSVPSSASLLISVRDLNDHAPHITMNTLLARDTNRSFVPEDAPIGHFVGHVIVKDPDSGTNGAFNCSLENRAFRLEQTFPEEYHVLTTKELDREQRNEYRLTMRCVDRGSPPMTSTKHISVVVTDVNDNAPVFREASYVAELFENNYHGAYVTRVNATDEDEGRNAEIVYGLGPNDLAFFDIDAVTGVISARDSLDRERRSEYNLRVVARDNGEPTPKTSTVSLLVKVLDVNDEKPLFTSAVYSFGVDENLPAGHEVGFLSAHDADSPPYNQHSMFLLPAGSLSDAFEMDDDTGMVRTTRPLDREQQSVYELIAVARDINSPTISSTATVSIHVMDLNDNPPFFIFPAPANRTVQLSHKVPLGHVVTQIKARDRDRDSNGKIMYQLTQGNTEGVFTVDPNSGALSVNVDLRDFPDNRSWHLEVSATDYGDPPLSSTTPLYIILNHSLSTGGGIFASLFSGSNFVILIAVGCISGALIVILLVVIVVLLRKQQMKRRRMQRYNCRMHALQRMTAEELKAAECKDIKQNQYTIIPKKEPTDGYNDDEKVDLSHEKSRQWLETLEPNRYEASPVRGGLAKKGGKQPTEGVPPQKGTAGQQPIKGEMVSTLLRASNNPNQRSLNCVPEDSASESVKSGDGSNTDSGRGHSDADDVMHGTASSRANHVQYTPLPPPPPPAPHYQTLPGSRYTRPNPQTFSSFRGSPTTDHNVTFTSPVATPVSNGTETVAIRPLGSPNLSKSSARRTPRMDDYSATVPRGPSNGWKGPVGAKNADRETNC